MKIKLLIFILLLFVSVYSFSQAPEINYQVKGRLMDSANDSLLGYGNVVIYKSGSNSPIVQMTGENGEFVFSDLHAGNYNLKVKLLGYKEWTKDSVLVNVHNPVVNLGDIKMQTDVKLLSEVTVVGNRLKGDVLIDRAVYNISPAVAKASSSGMDVLKKIPAIEIDIDHNITLEGSGNIQIYVDGKEVNKEYVYGLNPQLVEKIEVINNPSAKYDASITGVINIILKHQNVEGGSLNISTRIPVSETYGTDHEVSLTYNYHKITVDLNLYGELEKWDDDRRITRTSSNAHMLQYGTENSEYHGFHPSLTLGYFINKKNTLHLYIRNGTAGYYKTQDMRRDEDSIANNVAISTNYVSDKRCRWEYHSQVYSLFYKKVFSLPETELSTAITYSNWHDQVSDYNNDWPVANLSLSELREFATKNHEKVIFGKIDFTTKIAKNIKLETGYAVSNQRLANDLDGNTKTFENLLVYSNDSLKYDETRNAGYASLSGTINKFSWMAGFRLENSGIFINTHTKAGYTCLLPNISLQQKFKDKNSIKLTYRRRIVRPQSQHLNPFLKQNEKMTYEQGDPKIKPSYVNSFRFSFNYTMGKNMIIPELLFNYNQSNINRIMTVSNDGILTKSYKNGGNSYEYGANLSGQLQLFKWWALNPYSSIIRAKILGLKNDIFTIEEQTDLIWTLNMSSTLTFFKDLNIMMNFNYRNLYIAPQTHTYRDPYYSLSIEKGLFKQKAKIGIDVFTPFRTYYLASRQVNEAHDQYQDFKQTDEIKIVYNYRILLTFSYNLNWGQLENKNNINRNDINEGRGGGF
jgi:hypothetical protein